ncbi:MAG TPA: hypothetical protein VFX98_09910 [Longimicrobiaceae bacterium]|nr:hypothetical protein [Longimicrobiaceae bacterium]
MLRPAALLLLAGSIVLAPGCRRVAEESAAAATPADSAAAQDLAAADAVWAPIGRWMGTGDKGTERFTVADGEWRLVGRVGRLDKTKRPWIVVRVYDAERSQVATFSIEDIGADTSYLHTAPGAYHLAVSTGDARWELSAEERRLPAERVAP